MATYRDNWQINSYTGTASADLVYGLGQSDQLYGEGGSDTIYGGQADDDIWGGAAADRLYGDAGADYLSGDGGRDTLNGGGGQDNLDGGAANDTIDGGAGADTAHYDRTVSEYLWGPGGGGVQIEDTNTNNGDEGKDQLLNVETFAFDDQVFQSTDFADFHQIGRSTLLSQSLDGGYLWNGDGNTATNFKIVENDDAGIEIGLKAKIRQGPDVVPTGNTYEVPDGPQSTANGSQSDNANRAAWSFDYSINADTDDNGVPNDLRVVIDIDVDKSSDISFRKYIDFQFDNPLDDSAGDAAGTVWDNSKNFSFGEISSLFDTGSPYSMNDTGEHHIRLSVFNEQHLLASVTIEVDIV